MCRGCVCSTFSISFWSAESGLGIQQEGQDTGCLLCLPVTQLSLSPVCPWGQPEEQLQHVPCYKQHFPALLFPSDFLISLSVPPPLPFQLLCREICDDFHSSHALPSPEHFPPLAPAGVQGLSVLCSWDRLPGAAPGGEILPQNSWQARKYPACRSVPASSNGYLFIRLPKLY